MVTALTTYATNTTASVSTAAKCATATGGTTVNTNTLVGNTTQWVEVFGKGTAVSQTGQASIPTTPTGNGWLLDATTLEGKQLVAGTWTLNGASMGTNNTNAMTASLTVRAFRRTSAGVYTLIATMTDTPSSISSSTVVTYSSSGSGLATSFGVGDKLYYDVWSNITVANPASTTTLNIRSASTTTSLANRVQVTTPGYNTVTVDINDANVIFRQKSALDTNDTTVRFRQKSQPDVNDATVRFRLQIGSTPTSVDTKTRFRQKSAPDINDTPARFRQRSATLLKDVWLRLRTAQTTLSNLAARFKISVFQTKDSQTRYRQQSALVTANSPTRLKLSIPNLLNGVTRVRLRSALVLRDIALRTRLAQNVGKDSQSRFKQLQQLLVNLPTRLRLSIPVIRDVGIRARVSIPQTRDAVQRFKLRSAQLFKDTATRFRLQAASFKDAPIRLRQFTTSTKDSVIRVKLSVPQSRDTASRFRQLASLQKDSKTRIRLFASLQKDSKIRLRQVVTLLKDGVLRLKLIAPTLTNVKTRFALSIPSLRNLTIRFNQQQTTPIDAATRFVQISALALDLTAAEVAGNYISPFSAALTTTKGGSPTIHGLVFQFSGTNNYAEISPGFVPGGGVITVPTVPSIGAPSGHGWAFLPDAAVDGTFANEPWYASLCIYQNYGGSRPHLILRYFRYRAGIYTAIGTQPLLTGLYDIPLGFGILIPFAPTTFGPVSFNKGDILYIDLWIDDNNAGLLSVTGISYEENDTALGTQTNNTHIVTAGYSPNPSTIQTRFLQKSAQLLRDVSTRFRQAAQSLANSPIRLKLSTPVLGNNPLKLKLSILALRDTKTRFRLFTTSIRDAKVRLRQRSAQLLKDTATRLKLSTPIKSDTSARFIQISQTALTLYGSYNAAYTGTYLSVNGLTVNATPVITATWQRSHSGITGGYNNADIGPGGFGPSVPSITAPSFITGSQLSGWAYMVPVGGTLKNDGPWYAWIHIDNTTAITNSVTLTFQAAQYITATNSFVVLGQVTAILLPPNPSGIIAFTPGMMSPAVFAPGDALYFALWATEIGGFGTDTIDYSISRSADPSAPGYQGYTEFITPSFVPATQKDTSTRFILGTGTPVTRDTITRFRQRSQPVLPNLVTRFVQSIPTLKNSSTRFRILAKATRDIGVRLIQSVPVIKSATTRLRLAQQSLRNTSTRFKIALANTAAWDTVTRFRQRSAQILTNTPARFVQAVPVISNIHMRTRLAQSSLRNTALQVRFLSSAIVAMQLRMRVSSAVVIRDWATRVHVMSPVQVAWIVFRFRLSTRAQVPHDIPTRVVMAPSIVATQPFTTVTRSGLTTAITRSGTIATSTRDGLVHAMTRDGQMTISTQNGTGDSTTR